MKPRIKVLTLGVDDLERSLRFYREGLGLETEGIIGTEFVHGSVVFFDLEGGLKLALYPRKSLAHDSTLPLGPPSATELSIGHNVDSKAAVDAVMKQARAVWCHHRQAGAGHFLGWLRWILSRPRWASLGDRVESSMGSRR